MSIIFSACNNNSSSFGNTISGNPSTDEKFLGKWVYVTNVPADKTGDHTMDGTICSLTKLEGTNESYNFKYWNGMEGIFTKEDENTLKAIDAKIQLKYIGENQHLILKLNENEGIEWSKLK